MKKKSVLMVIAEYPTTYGHTTVIDNLSIGLKKLGLRTAIGAFSFKKEPPNGVEKVVLSKLNLLLKGANDLDFDIIHIHHTQVLYYLLTKNTSKSIILHQHGLANKIQEKNFLIAMKLYSKKIQKIIAISEDALEHMKRVNSKLSAVVVYNGANTEIYNPKLSQDYKKGNPQLLFVGALRNYKKTSQIVSIMPKLMEKYPNAHLQIAGDGPEIENLRSIIKEKNLEKNVDLLGMINVEELRLRYASCDIYVSASTFDPCPLPVFEAMASGKPIILSNIKAHSKLVTKSNAGVVFDDNDDLIKKIILVFDNKESYEINAKEFSKEYDWKKVCERILSIYDEVEKPISINLKLKIVRIFVNSLIKLKIDRIIPTNSQLIYNLVDNIIKSSTSSEDVFKVENFKMVKGRTTRYSIITGKLCDFNISKIIRNKVKNGMIILDIGSNIGGTSLLFSELSGPQGHIYSFEPEPTLFRVLKKNVKLNNLQNISLFQIAVSNQTGTSFLSINPKQDGDNRVNIKKIGKNSIEVNTVRIDEFCKKQNIVPDFIKMDIQGYEPKVLEGMFDMLKKQPNIKLLTEFYPSAIKTADSSPKKFLTDLQNCGFNIYQISNAGQLEEFSMNKLLEIKNDNYVDLYCEKSNSKK